MTRPNAGIALVVILLFTAVVLMLVVGTVAVVSLSTRSGGANERAAYQALLSAESAINTVGARASVLPPGQLPLKKEGDSDWFKRWFSNSGLGTVTTPDGGATLTLTPIGGPGRPDLFELLARGSAGGGSAFRRVAVNAKAVQIVSQRFNIGSAVTSAAPVSLRGGARVSGGAGALPDGGLYTLGRLRGNAASVPGSATTFSLTLDAPTDVAVGDYIKVDASTVKVTGTDAATNSVSVTRLDGDGDTIALVPAAPVYGVDRPLLSAAALGAGLFDVGGGRTLLADDPSTLGVDESLVYVTTRLNGTRYVLRGQVTARPGAVSDRVAVTWQAYSALPAAPPQWAALAGSALAAQPLPEGAALRQDTFGAVSAGAITADGSNEVISDGAVAASGRLRALDPHDTDRAMNLDGGGNDLFASVFGRRLSEMLPARAWPALPTDGRPLGGLNVFEGTGVGVSLCGGGVLIVRTTLKVDGTCKEGFKGLIYVLGGYEQRGEANISGALVVEGAPGTCGSQACGVDIGGGQITYDAGALKWAERSAAPYTLSVEPNSWRER